MTKITIEQGHPLPPPATRGRKPRYPFDDMAVGDSFAVGAAMLEPARYATMRANKKYQGERVFAYRKESPSKGRVWRIS